MFEAWAPQTSTRCSLVTYTQADCVLRISHAQPTPSLLRCRIPALYHHELLPAASFARQPRGSRLVSSGSGAGAGALSFRGRGIRRHAGTRSLAHHRTGGGNAVPGAVLASGVPPGRG